MEQVRTNIGEWHMVVYLSSLSKLLPETSRPEDGKDTGKLARAYSVLWSQVSSKMSWSRRLLVGSLSKPVSNIHRSHHQACHEAYCSFTPPARPLPPLVPCVSTRPCSVRFRSSWCRSGLSMLQATAVFVAGCLPDVVVMQKRAQIGETSPPANPLRARVWRWTVLEVGGGEPGRSL